MSFDVRAWSIRVGVAACAVLPPVLIATPAHANAADWDIAAVGATASGPAGSIVRVTLGIRNLGPGDAPAHQGVLGSVTGFRLTLPPDVTLVRTILGCTPPIDRRNDCTTALQNGVPAGQALVNQYDLRIGDFTGERVGRVQAFFSPPKTPEPGSEINPANDSAAIVIRRTTGSPHTGTLPITGSRPALVGAGGFALTVLGTILALAGRPRGRRAQTPS